MITFEIAFERRTDFREEVRTMSLLAWRTSRVADGNGGFTTITVRNPERDLVINKAISREEIALCRVDVRKDADRQLADQLAQHILERLGLQ